MGGVGGVLLWFGTAPTRRSSRRKVGKPKVIVPFQGILDKGGLGGGAPKDVVPQSRMLGRGLGAKGTNATRYRQTGARHKDNGIVRVHNALGQFIEDGVGTTRGTTADGAWGWWLTMTGRAATDALIRAALFVAARLGGFYFLLVVVG